MLREGISRSWSACNVRVKLWIISSLSLVNYRLWGCGCCSAVHLGQQFISSMSLLLFSTNPLSAQFFYTFTLRRLCTLTGVPMVAVTQALHGFRKKQAKMVAINMFVLLVNTVHLIGVKMWTSWTRLYVLPHSGVNAANVGVNAAGVRTPQYLTCRGPSMCWIPAIIATQSRIRCTIFINVIDFMLSAVIEQVYSSTFKFFLLKKQEICPLKCLIFTSKCTKMMVAGLCLDSLGELTVLPQSP